MKPTPLVRPAVGVLNQSRRTGLADRVATALRATGWSVSKVSNYRGNVAATTVFYGPGQEQVAALLAADLPGATRTAPVIAGLSRTRLTVVLTADYPG